MTALSSTVKEIDREQEIPEPKVLLVSSKHGTFWGRRALRLEGCIEHEGFVFGMMEKYRVVVMRMGEVESGAAASARTDQYHNGVGYRVNPSMGADCNQGHDCSHEHGHTGGSQYIYDVNHETNPDDISSAPGMTVLPDEQAPGMHLTILERYCIDVGVEIVDAGVLTPNRIDNSMRHPSSPRGYQRRGSSFSEEDRGGDVLVVLLRNGKILMYQFHAVAGAQCVASCELHMDGSKQNRAVKMEEESFFNENARLVIEGPLIVCVEGHGRGWAVLVSWKEMPDSSMELKNESVGCFALGIDIDPETCLLVGIGSSLRGVNKDDTNMSFDLIGIYAGSMLYFRVEKKSDGSFESIIVPWEDTAADGFHRLLWDMVPSTTEEYASVQDIGVSETFIVLVLNHAQDKRQEFVVYNRRTTHMHSISDKAVEEQLQIRDIDHVCFISPDFAACTTVYGTFIVISFPMEQNIPICIYSTKVRPEIVDEAHICLSSVLMAPSNCLWGIASGENGFYYLDGKFTATLHSSRPDGNSSPMRSQAALVLTSDNPAPLAVTLSLEPMINGCDRMWPIRDDSGNDVIAIILSSESSGTRAWRISEGAAFQDMGSAVDEEQSTIYAGVLSNHIVQVTPAEIILSNKDTGVVTRTHVNDLIGERILQATSSVRGCDSLLALETVTKNGDFVIEIYRVSTASEIAFLKSKKLESECMAMSNICSFNNGATFTICSRNYTMTTYLISWCSSKGCILHDIQTSCPFIPALQDEKGDIFGRAQSSVLVPERMLSCCTMYPKSENDDCIIFEVIVSDRGGNLYSLPLRCPSFHHDTYSTELFGFGAHRGDEPSWLTVYHGSYITSLYLLPSDDRNNKGSICAVSDGLCLISTWDPSIVLRRLHVKGVKLAVPCMRDHMLCLMETEELRLISLCEDDMCRVFHITLPNALQPTHLMAHPLLENACFVHAYETSPDSAKIEYLLYMNFRTSKKIKRKIVSPPHESTKQIEILSSLPANFVGNSELLRWSIQKVNKIYEIMPTCYVLALHGHLDDNQMRSMEIWAFFETKSDLVAVTHSPFVFSQPLLALSVVNNIYELPACTILDENGEVNVPSIVTLTQHGVVYYVHQLDSPRTMILNPDPIYSSTSRINTRKILASPFGLLKTAACGASLQPFPFCKNCRSNMSLLADIAINTEHIAYLAALDKSDRTVIVPLGLVTDDADRLYMYALTGDSEYHHIPYLHEKRPGVLHPLEIFKLGSSIQKISAECYRMRIMPAGMEVMPRAMPLACDIVTQDHVFSLCCIGMLLHDADLHATSRWMQFLNEVDTIAFEKFQNMFQCGIPARNCTKLKQQYCGVCRFSSRGSCQSKQERVHCIHENSFLIFFRQCINNQHEIIREARQRSGIDCGISVQALRQCLLYSFSWMQHLRSSDMLQNTNGLNTSQK